MGYLLAKLLLEARKMEMSSARCCCSLLLLLHQQMAPLVDWTCYRSCYCSCQAACCCWLQSYL